jgi:hypothetical protein
LRDYCHHAGLLRRPFDGCELRIAGRMRLISPRHGSSPANIL